MGTSTHKYPTHSYLHTHTPTRTRTPIYLTSHTTIILHPSMPLVYLHKCIHTALGTHTVCIPTYEICKYTHTYVRTQPGYTYIHTYSIPTHTHTHTRHNIHNHAYSTCYLFTVYIYTHLTVRTHTPMHTTKVKGSMKLVSGPGGEDQIVSVNSLNVVLCS